VSKASKIQTTFPRRQTTQATQCRALRPPRFEKGEWPQTCCPVLPGGVQEVYGAEFTGTQVWTARLRECDPRGSRIFWVGGVVVRILVILADVFLLVASRKFTGTGANLIYRYASMDRALA